MEMDKGKERTGGGLLRRVSNLRWGKAKEYPGALIYRRMMGFRGLEIHKDVKEQLRKNLETEEKCFYLSLLVENEICWMQTPGVAWSNILAALVQSMCGLGGFFS